MEFAAPTCWGCATEASVPCGRSSAAIPTPCGVGVTGVCASVIRSTARQLSLGLRQCSKGDRLNEHLPVLLVQLTKRPQLREKATRVLELLEQNGGKAAYDAIKSKVPTYCGVGSF